MISFNVADYEEGGKGGGGSLAPSVKNVWRREAASKHISLSYYPQQERWPTKCQKVCCLWEDDLIISYVFFHMIGYLVGNSEIHRPRICYRTLLHLTYIFWSIVIPPILYWVANFIQSTPPISFGVLFGLPICTELKCATLAQFWGVQMFSMNANRVWIHPQIERSKTWNLILWPIWSERQIIWQILVSN